MKNLINAIQVRKKYNDMDFDDFVILYEKYYDVKISKHKINPTFQFAGLYPEVMNSFNILPDNKK